VQERTSSSMFSRASEVRGMFWEKESADGRERSCRGGALNGFGKREKRPVCVKGVTLSRVESDR